MKAHRRFTTHKPVGRPLTLGLDHPAVVEGRTLFRKSIAASADMPRLLKPGINSRKIGSRIVKGPLVGMPIYTLTLEERATCPRSCSHWADCYGNKMHWSKRIQADDEFLPRLHRELLELAGPRGISRFMVRLHVLGDFYSTDYVDFWRRMLAALPGLHVFGYTARQGDFIAQRIKQMNWSPRSWIRFSDGGSKEFRTVSIDRPQDAGNAIVCPAQHHPKADRICCGSCALCWSTDRPIAFLRH